MASNNKNTNNSQSNDDDWIADLILSLFKAAGYLLVGGPVPGNQHPDDRQRGDSHHPWTTPGADHRLLSLLRMPDGCGWTRDRFAPGWSIRCGGAG